MGEMTVTELIAIANALKPAPTAPGVPAPYDHGLGIVVLERGFVYVGHVKTDSEWCVISDAKNVRRWGTERGLLQLANEGPRPETKLDAPRGSGTVRAPMRAVIHIIPCRSESWTKIYS